MVLKINQKKYKDKLCDGALSFVQAFLFKSGQKDVAFADFSSASWLSINAASLQV